MFLRQTANVHKRKADEVAFAGIDDPVQHAAPREDRGTQSLDYLSQKSNCHRSQIFTELRHVVNCVAIYREMGEDVT